MSPPSLADDRDSASLPSEAAILDALPDAVLVVDADDRIRFVNSGAEDFFQASSTTLVRYRLTDLVHSSSPLREAVTQVRAAGGVVTKYAVNVGTPRTGGERPVDLQATSVSDNPSFVVVMLLARSMAHKIDRQLTHRGAARSVSGMASMLAHEIKNPLAGIRGAAQLLEPALGSDDRALTRLICSETDRIRDLVDQMEVFSDERPPERKPVNIHVVLAHVKSLVEAGLSHPVTIREEYDPSLPPLLGNRDQLIQIFVNLVKNAVEAIEATGQAGEITLSTAFRPGMKLSVSSSSDRISLPLEVCVHDTGSGIPEDVRPHIFDPFVTTKSGGRGLGLALVAKIVQDHGGVVESFPRDRGTTFRILLPVLRNPIEIPETEAVS
ncbi:MAG: PAS domain-containing protein [Rhizobiales bacterium]|nr:PAS domain-containing protein [Hyphomicrobiales bacterium]